MKTRELTIFIICIVLTAGLAVNAHPMYEKEICNLGWEHYKHQHPEAAYQNAWCKAHNGIMEYENSDKTRVDCLTSTHAVEFDFWHKWAESVGQALHYGLMTGKKPKVVLILENPKGQMCYYKRVRNLSAIYNFDVEYITPDILQPCKHEVASDNNHNN